MDEVQRFIANNQHQFGYIMQEASRQWVAKDPVGALTVGDCHSVVQRHGQYHELLERIVKAEQVIKETWSGIGNDMDINPTTKKVFLAKLEFAIRTLSGNG